MIRAAVLSFSLIALTACSGEPAQQESADDFGNRIGGQGGQAAPAAIDPAQPDPNAPSVAVAVPPPNADLTQLQKLGDIGGVNLGPREGSCAFMADGAELIMAAGMKEPTIPGKAVVRLGGSLVTADAGPGGLASIKSGTTFTGEGFIVQVAPVAGEAQSRAANVVVRQAGGNSQNYSGNWICA